ncbi:hypothetical protein [Mucilaginibacter ginsenosidivorax]|uniref:Uncharacterized protein n=1 Tax=Mucilaginibacter ginsenosidivorax TaxID=862126 RepID=A0A5B8W634_9SPHI|nr:hypothetical protein [Mucilaginibacter ginsenosidivorax]QEC78907.1 hypothetical protein FSB76_24250 [Mucilaginibacter ginsenosidivorax]
MKFKTNKIMLQKLIIPGACIVLISSVLCYKFVTPEQKQPVVVEVGPAPTLDTTKFKIVKPSIVKGRHPIENKSGGVTGVKPTTGIKPK